MIIKDGKGKGHSARVTIDNALYTMSNIKDLSIEQSIHNAYAFNWYSGEITEAATEKLILSVANSSPDLYLVINKIVLAADGDGWFFASSGGTITGGISLDPVNLNLARQSVTVSELSAISGTTAATIAGESVIFPFYFPTTGGTIINKIDEGIILSNNAKFSITFLGNGTATKVHAVIRGYLIDEEQT